MGKFRQSPGIAGSGHEGLINQNLPLLTYNADKVIHNENEKAHFTQLFIISHNKLYDIPLKKGKYYNGHTENIKLYTKKYFKMKLQTDLTKRLKNKKYLKISSTLPPDKRQKIRKAAAQVCREEHEKQIRRNQQTKEK